MVSYNKNSGIKVTVTSDIDPLKDPMVKLVSRKDKFVTDGILDDFLNWNYRNSIFISAMTGRGKNTFIENKLIPLIEKTGGRILIVTNRLTTARQMKDRIANKFEFHDYLEFYTDSGKNNIEDLGFITVITYQKLAIYLNNQKKCRELKRYSMVCLDEIHFFISDSLFNNETEKILRKFLLLFKQSIRIYMTATPKEIFPIILNAEKQLLNTPAFNLHCINNPFDKINKKIIFFNFKRNYSYIVPRYFNTKKDILNLIKNDKTSNKWIIFVETKKEGENFVDELGSTSVFISSESKNSKKIDGKIYNEIITEEKFSCKILVSTSVADNGLNIKDPSLKNIVLFTSDQTEFVQMLGRKRIEPNENLNAYLCSRNKSYFVFKLNQINKQIEALNFFRENSYSSFLDKYFNSLEIVKGLFYFNKGIIKINSLAEKKIFINKCFYEKIISKFDSGLKNYFILEQLSWINLEKTYNLKYWIDYVNPDISVTNLIKFLDSNCNKPLYDQDLHIFQKDFKHYVNTAYGTQKGDRTDRPEYKSTKMQTIFKKYSLPYKIHSNNNQYILSKI